MADFNSDGKAIMAIFIGAIIAIVFLATIADSIFTQTNTFESINTTVTMPSINGTLDLTGREIVSTIEIYNATNASQSETTELNGSSLVTGITRGLNTVQLTIDDDSGARYAGSEVNISYVYLPEGYVSDSSARAVTRLITIFGALAILIFVIVVLIKNGSLGELIRRG